MEPSNSLVLKTTVLLMVATAPVACPHVLLDKPVQLVQANVRTLHAQILLEQNRSLVSKTAAEIQLATPVNVVRTVVILDKLVPHRPTRACTLLAQVLTARKFLLVPMTSTTVNVVRPVVILDNFVPLLATPVRT